MRSFWSDSKLADAILRAVGAPLHPGCATAEVHRAYEKEVRAAHPYAWWLTQTVFDGIQEIALYPLEKWEDAVAYYHNRFVSRSHILRTGLRPGGYHTADEQILEGLFKRLVDFVEVEEAWHHCACDKEARAKFNRPKRSAWTEWRCPEAGLEQLEWASNLLYSQDDGIGKDDPLFGKPIPQAEDAREIRRLYRWWTIERPKRPDPYEASGWSTIGYSLTNKDGDWVSFSGRSPEEWAESSRQHTLLRRMEEEQLAEDEEALCSLIRIRHALST